MLLFPNCKCTILYLSKTVILLFFKLGYSYFTMLCQFLLYNEVNKLYVCVYIYIYISSPPWTTSLPPTQFHPSRSPQSTKLSSLCCIAGSHGLFILHMVICICQPNLPVHLTPSFPTRIHMSICYICVSIPALQRGCEIIEFCKFLDFHKILAF